MPYACEAINTLFFGELEDKFLINGKLPTDELMEIILEIRDVNNHNLRAYGGEFAIKYLPAYKKVKARIIKFRQGIKNIINSKVAKYEE